MYIARCCKLLLTYTRMMCVSAAACSGSVQVLGLDRVTHSHKLRHNVSYTRTPTIFKVVNSETE
jgi:hypothetical protein